MQEAPRLPLTERCPHYEEVQEVPWDLQKYWQQRYSIFSWYDYDIRLTDDAWFGVTPEPVANKIAEDVSSWAGADKDTIVDLFGGVGGNAIAFALSERWARVVAVEKDADTLACAQHNAEVYGCGEWITWVNGDCFDFLGEQRHGPEGAAESAALPASLALQPDKTVVFASPPWGGVGYRDHDVFDLSTMEPYSLASLHRVCKPYDHVLYLPRTSDIRQLAKLVPDGRKIDVVQYCMAGASKAMAAYFPASSKD